MAILEYRYVEKMLRCGVEAREEEIEIAERLLEGLWEEENELERTLCCVAASGARGVASVIYVSYLENGKGEGAEGMMPLSKEEEEVEKRSCFGAEIEECQVKLRH